MSIALLIKARSSSGVPANSPRCRRRWYIDGDGSIDLYQTALTIRSSLNQGPFGQKDLTLRRLTDRSRDRASLTFGVKVDGQILEDVHVRRVRDGGHRRGIPLAVDVRDCLRAHVHDERVDERDVVFDAAFAAPLRQGQRLRVGRFPAFDFCFIDLLNITNIQTKKLQFANKLSLENIKFLIFSKITMQNRQGNWNMFCTNRNAVIVK